MITLSNDFHGTKTKTRSGRKSARQMSDLKRRLCGIAGCCCSNDIGARGPQTQADGSELLIERESFGSVVLSSAVPVESIGNGFFEALDGTIIYSA
jgi:hypothetical protein